MYSKSSKKNNCIVLGGICHHSTDPCSLNTGRYKSRILRIKNCIRDKNPGTEIGSPGPLQGVNTGVVLLNLERMRKSKKFNSYLEPKEIDQLCQKFSFKGFIGDQVKTWKGNFYIFL